MMEARHIERICLRTASSLGAMVTDTQVQSLMPQGGYTEVMNRTPEHVERLIDGTVA
jgi:hypothetical protein